MLATCLQKRVLLKRLTDHGGSGMEWGGQGSPEVYSAGRHRASLGGHLSMTFSRFRGEPETIQKRACSR
jgi:hypothetical protein